MSLAAYNLSYCMAKSMHAIFFCYNRDDHTKNKNYLLRVGHLLNRVRHVLLSHTQLHVPQYY